MCEECVKKAKEDRDKNNKMVEDRIAKGLPLFTREGVMGTIGHINFGFPCIHQLAKNLKPTKL